MKLCIQMLLKQHRHSSEKDISLVTMATGLPSFIVEKVNLPYNFVLPSSKIKQFIITFLLMRFHFQIYQAFCWKIYTTTIKLEITWIWNRKNEIL